MRRKVFVVEPYLFWKGHFRVYFENLLTDMEDYIFIYCNDKKEDYPNSIYIKAYTKECEECFTCKILCRLINSFKIIFKLNKIIKNGDVVHFIEYEPLSFLFFHVLTAGKKKHVILTIHSIDRVMYSNILKDLISAIQRFLFRIGLRMGKHYGYLFVVHYDHHKNQLQDLVDEDVDIRVVEYPCPDISLTLQEKIFSGRNKLLIFGQIREDKGFYEFLSNSEIKNLQITIAGKIYDKRLKSLFSNRNYTFIDKFLSEKEIRELFKVHDFCLLPYQKNYTGGAGPLKDSLAYLTPVIASDIPIFREIVEHNKVGFIYESIDHLLSLLKNLNLTKEEYMKLVRNCYEYAQNINWNYMKEKYYKIYEEVRNK